MAKTDSGIMCNCSHDKPITTLLPMQRDNELFLQENHWMLTL